MDPHDTYLLHRDHIERALKVVCGRTGLSGHDAEDFCSAFRLHLMEDDYRPIRKFQGRSSIQTYLVAVITHYFQDWRNARWGKWRPSAEARRLGPVAIRLETLVVRDRMSFDEAYELLRTRDGVTASRAEIERMASRLPRRTGRTFVSEVEASALPAPGPMPDSLIAQRDAGEAARFALHALRTALAAQPAQDRLIVRLRVEEGRSAAEIARLLHVEQKPLYRRVQYLLATLRAHMERVGVSAEAVADLLEQRGVEAAAEGAERENVGEVRLFTGARPSMDAKGGAR